MTPIQIFLLILWSAWCYMDIRIFRLCFFRPLLAGIGAGIILGEPAIGCMAAGTIALTFLGIVEVGGSLPPDAIVGGVLSTSLAVGLIEGGHATLEAIALANAITFPIAVISAQNWVNVAYSISMIPQHLADGYAETGNTRMMSLVHLGMIPLYGLICVWPIALFLFIGPSNVVPLVAAIPQWTMNGLVVASWAMTFVGLGILLSLMWKPTLVGFLFLGFVLNAYLNVPVLAVALLALTLVSVVHYVTSQKEGGT